MKTSLSIFLLFLFIFQKVACQENQEPSQPVEPDEPAVPGEGEEEACNSASNPRSYEDCKTYISEANEDSICCFVSGTSNGTDESSCLAVDILFQGKIIEYNGKTATGRLVCTSESWGFGLIVNKNVLFSLLLILLF